VIQRFKGKYIRDRRSKDKFKKQATYPEDVDHPFKKRSNKKVLKLQKPQ
jgi:hypothetical protein